MKKAGRVMYKLASVLTHPTAADNQAHRTFVERQIPPRAVFAIPFAGFQIVPEVLDKFLLIRFRDKTPGRLAEAHLRIKKRFGTGKIGLVESIGAIGRNGDGNYINLAAQFTR